MINRVSPSQMLLLCNTADGGSRFLLFGWINGVVVISHDYEAVIYNLSTSSSNLGTRGRVLMMAFEAFSMDGPKIL